MICFGEMFGNETDRRRFAGRLGSPLRGSLFVDVSGPSA
jgi:hypothetical protein